MKTYVLLFLLLLPAGCGKSDSRKTALSRPIPAATNQPTANPNEEAVGDNSPVGCYADLARIGLGEDMTIVFIPSLSSVLEYHERKIGRSLTESEVLAFRDQAMATTLSDAMADQVATNRGIVDLDPENCWVEWQARHGIVERPP